LYFDSSHFPCSNGQGSGEGNPKRVSLWEIHPIYKFEVCTGNCDGAGTWLPLDEWVKRETKLGNATLSAEVKNGNRGLEQVKRWSDAVNVQIADIVKGVPPFPLVRECLEKINRNADAMCVSQTPAEALKREWAEHDIEPFVRMIAGQEMGTKTEHLKFAAAGKYGANNILMIGDAPGDYKAARANGALFFPILAARSEILRRAPLSLGLAPR